MRSNKLNRHAAAYNAAYPGSNVVKFVHRSREKPDRRKLDDYRDNAARIRGMFSLSDNHKFFHQFRAPLWHLNIFIFSHLKLSNYNHKPQIGIPVKETEQPTGERLQK